MHAKITHRHADATLIYCLRLQVISLEEESKYLIRAQKMLRALSLSVDLDAAGNFQVCHLPYGLESRAALLLADILQRCILLAPPSQILSPRVRARCIQHRAKPASSQTHECHTPTQEHPYHNTAKALSQHI